MSDNAVRGRASIIIPCWNQLEFTRKCLTALFRQTCPNWELIVINNGSTDGTTDYLAGVQDVSPMPVTLIANGTNRGFPAAVNQGLQFARGEYLVRLNNDVVVTDGWLDQLIALVSINAEANGTAGHSECKIALVGPMSNYAAPPQLVENVPYRDLDEMKVFARQWRDDHCGTWFTIPKLSGFCLLMKRAVYDAIGGLDERFGLGFFDDDDLAERARRAGFELAVAHDLFVHHFGSRTFVGNGIDAQKLLDENSARFAVKWGNTVPHGRRVTLKPFEAARQASVRSRGNSGPSAESAGTMHTRNGTDVRLKPNRLDSTDRARVSLTMIVRNEEANSGQCLGSVKGLFDEIIVLDTGSRDRTIEIARSFGARVFDFVWVDDFACCSQCRARASQG